MHGQSGKALAEHLPGVLHKSLLGRQIGRCQDIGAAVEKATNKSRGTKGLPSRQLGTRSLTFRAAQETRLAGATDDIEMRYIEPD